MFQTDIQTLTTPPFCVMCLLYTVSHFQRDANFSLQLPLQ